MIFWAGLGPEKCKRSHVVCSDCVLIKRKILAFCILDIFPAKNLRVEKDIRHHSENPRPLAALRLPRTRSSKVYLKSVIVIQRWKPQDFHTRYIQSQFILQQPLFPSCFICMHTHLSNEESWGTEVCLCYPLVAQHECQEWVLCQITENFCPHISPIFGAFSGTVCMYWDAHDLSLPTVEWSQGMDCQKREEAQPHRAA